VCEIHSIDKPIMATGDSGAAVICENPDTKLSGSLA